MTSRTAEVTTPRGVEPGAPAPPGATATAAGVNFSVFARRAREPWRRCIDTSLESPDDICRWDEAPCLPPAACVVQARSVILLAAALQRGAGEPLRVTVIQ